MGAPKLTMRDPSTALDGLIGLTKRLITDFGIDISLAELDDDVGWFDGDRGTVVLDQDSPVVDQFAFIVDCWMLCACGPHAAPNLEPMPDRPQLAVVVPSENSA